LHALKSLNESVQSLAVAPAAADVARLEALGAVLVDTLREDGMVAAQLDAGADGPATKHSNPSTYRDGRHAMRSKASREEKRRCGRGRGLVQGHRS
jgi:hypothetical protein